MTRILAVFGVTLDTPQLSISCDPGGFPVGLKYFSFNLSIFQNSSGGFGCRATRPTTVHRKFFRPTRPNAAIAAIAALQGYLGPIKSAS
jgi:hypothetical protein